MSETGEEIIKTTTINNIVKVNDYIAVLDRGYICLRDKNTGKETTFDGAKVVFGGNMGEAEVETGYNAEGEECNLVDSSEWYSFAGSHGAQIGDRGAVLIEKNNKYFVCEMVSIPR